MGKIMDYKFDVVVLTHNNIRYTIECMDCLYAHTGAPFHLIIADDSTDGLTPLYFEQLKKAKDNFIYLRSEEPYKSGNQIFNIAIEYCKTPYMATVMNSVMVEPNWAALSFNLMENDPTVGTIGMKSLFARSGLIECAGIYIEDYLPCDIGRDEPSHRLNEIYQCEATQWAFAFHRIKAIKGNIAEDAYHGFVGVDDIDNCFIVRSKGWKVIYNGSGIAYHHPRATRGRNDKVAYDMNRENLETFYKRWGYWNEFRKANPEVPETVKDVKFIADGKEMRDKEFAARNINAKV